jgi:hypothetical protein
MKKVQKKVKASSDQLSNSAKFKDILGKKTKKSKNVVNHQKKEKNNPREEIKKRLREIQKKLKPETLKKGNGGVEIGDVEQKRLFQEGKTLKNTLEGWSKHNNKKKHKNKRNF